MTFWVVIFLLVGILIFFLLVFLTISIKKRRIGIWGEILYKDIPKSPGKNLYSSIYPLVGKPDYLVKIKNQTIPIEVKTGKTPKLPYQNHIMQLMAYCLLVEENYHSSVSFGIISYPDKKFEIKYTKEVKTKLINLIYQMLEYKNGQSRLDFNNIRDELCLKCQKEIN